MYKESQETKEISKTTQEEKQIKEEVSKKEVLGDIVTFKSEKAVEEEAPVKKELHDIKQVKIQPQKESKKEEYYYPSFLNATYSLDSTPLKPMPNRSRDLILHKVLGDEREKESESNVAIRGISTYIGQEQVSRQGYNSVHGVTEDVLRENKSEKHELTQRLPMSLMKVASLGIAVLLFASVVTFIPSVSVFSANTGTLKAVFSLNILKKDTHSAGMTASVSKTSPIETIVKVFNSIFEDKIIYKAK